MSIFKPHIKLDLDGVLFDFEKKAFELFGDKWEEEIRKPEWGRFIEYPNIYEILEPFVDAIRLYEYCVSFTGSKNLVTCLTALPNRARHHFPDAAKHKIESVRKHISPDLRVSFGPFASDKKYHVYHKDDILIDDMQINIDQWNAAGGIGILHTSVYNTIKQLENLKNNCTIS